MCGRTCLLLCNCVRWINLINQFGRGFLFFFCFETSGHGALHILAFESRFVFQAHPRFESFAFYYPLPLSQSIRVTFCLDSGWLTSRYLTALTNEVDGHLTGRLRKVLSVPVTQKTLLQWSGLYTRYSMGSDDDRWVYGNNGFWFISYRKVLVWLWSYRFISILWINISIIV